MEKEDLINEANKKLLKKLNKKIFIFRAIILGAFLIVIFNMEKSLYGIITTIGFSCFFMMIYFIVKIALKQDRILIKKLRKKDYEIFEDVVKEYDDTTIDYWDEYDRITHQTTYFIRFENTNLVYGVPAHTHKYEIGEKVLCQKIKYKLLNRKEIEEIINVIKLNES